MVYVRKNGRISTIYRPISCGYEFNRFDAYETKNIFPASTFLFELFPFKRTMFTRRCFARSSRLWIIIKLLYRSRFEGTRFIHVRYRTIKRIDALFLTERIHALRALHACTVSSRELDSTSWTNSSTRFPVSLFPTEENSCRKEQCSITFANPSIRNVIF